MKHTEPIHIAAIRRGFTLIELLVVLAIIVALFAILAPNIFSYRNKANIDQAKSQINLFQRALEAYASEFGSYPSTEQGLKALIYVPANETTGLITNMNPMMNQQPGMANGMAMGGDANSMMGGAAAVGGLQQPGMNMDTTGGMQPGMGIGGMQPGMGMDTTGGMQPGMGVGGMQPGMGMDATGGAMGVGGIQPGMGAASGAMGTGWNQPLANPNLYVNARKRSTTYLEGDEVSLDPWRNPYRYDNTINAAGVNPYTGERKPAIWSAGPDKQDGTEDDIRNWDPKVAQQQLMHSQQSGAGLSPGMQGNVGNMQGGMQPGMGMDSTGGMGISPPGGMQPGGMGMDPSGGMQPGGMGMAPPGGIQPGGMGGMQPGGMTAPGGIMTPGQ